LKKVPISWGRTGERGCRRGHLADTVVLEKNLKNQFKQQNRIMGKDLTHPDPKGDMGKERTTKEAKGKKPKKQRRQKTLPSTPKPNGLCEWQKVILPGGGKKTKDLG